MYCNRAIALKITKATDLTLLTVYCTLVQMFKYSYNILTIL